MDWLFGYLLIGFVIHFAATEIARIPPNDSWRWELAAVVFWPLTVAVAIVGRVRQWPKRIHR